MNYFSRSAKKREEEEEEQTNVVTGISGVINTWIL